MASACASGHRQMFRMAGFYHSWPLAVQLLERLPQAIKSGPGLAAYVDFNQFMKVEILDRVPDRIPFKSERKVSVLAGIGECTFPKTIRIDRLLPDVVIAFVDRVAQGDSGALDGPYVIAEIH